MDYEYIVFNNDRQVIKGKVTAVSELAAADVLANSGYQVISLRQSSKLFPTVGRLFEKKVKKEELVVMSRQLALLISSGIGMIQSLELLGDQTMDKQLKKVLAIIITDLRSGSSLGNAMGRHTNVFPNIYSKMVSVGEETGSLDTILRNLADYLEREHRAVAKLKSAMLYPVTVLILGIIVAGILVGFVLPPIVGLFSALGGKLPLITQILIGAVEFLNTSGLYVLIALLSLVLAAILYVKTPAGRYRWDALLLKIPLVGRLLHVNELARLCRNMSLLFRAGLPLTEIMNLSSKSSGNSVLSNAIKEVGEDSLRGQGLSMPMRKREIFLPMMVEMTKVGEETGNLEETLLMVAENYETEAESRTQRLLTMIEPTMTIIMGVLVGFLALSVFIPLYSSLSLID